MKLGSAWGLTQSGVQSLWSGQDASGVARNAAFEAAQRFQAELGYGLDGFRGRGALLPFVGLRLSGSGRDWRAGLGWTLGANTSFELKATRSESAMAPPDHGIALKASLRW